MNGRAIIFRDFGVHLKKKASKNKALEASIFENKKTTHMPSLTTFYALAIGFYLRIATRTLLCPCKKLIFRSHGIFEHWETTID